MPQRLPAGAVVTAWLMVAFVAGLIWLLTNYPGNPTERPFADGCETIAQHDQNAERSQESSAQQMVSSPSSEIKAAPGNPHPEPEDEHRTNERRLAEYTCQLAVYTAQMATFTKWLVGVTVVVALVGIWQGFQLSRHAGHMESSAEAANRAARAAGDQLRQMQRQSNAMRTTANAAVSAERAYIFGGGVAMNASVENMGSGLEVVHRYPHGLATIFDLQVNNYGKTPGELIQIKFGFLRAEIPDIVPEFTDSIFYQNWIKPGATGEHIKYVTLPKDFKNIIIFGRV